MKIHLILFINSSDEEHLGCFQVLAITNNAVMKTVEWVSFRYMFKSGIAGS